MPKRSLWIVPVVLVTLMSLIGPAVAAAAEAQGREIPWFNGPVTHWPATWAPIAGLNDPKDEVSPATDFVGSPASPGGYFAVDEQYVYFRVRVGVGEVAALGFPLTSQDVTPPAGWNDRTFRHRILLAIDNTADARPDWGFAWDTRRWPYYQRGLELLSLDDGAAASPAPGWSQLQEADRDGSAKVSPPDFRWNSTDGYVRTVDQQPTADFGPTTFVDFAVSWDFLARQRSTGNPLLPGQVWRIQFVSQAGEDGSTDVAGAGATGDGAGGWGATIAVVPPPARMPPTQSPPTATPAPTLAATEPAPAATPTLSVAAAANATRAAIRNLVPSPTPAQPGTWQPGRFAGFLAFRYPSGWSITGRGDTNVLRGEYKGHAYVIDVYRPERPVGTSLEGWVEAELKRFRANPDAVTVRSLTFARVPATRVGLLDLPGGECPAVRIYAWSEDPPVPDIQRAMITVSLADEEACDTNSLNTFVDMLIVMANK